MVLSGIAVCPKRVGVFCVQALVTMNAIENFRSRTQTFHASLVLVVFYGKNLFSTHQAR